MTQMKKVTLATLAFFSMVGFMPQKSQAFIPVSAVTDVEIAVYGMYTTSDASCRTGWQAVLPFNASPVNRNFAAAGGVALGTGSISNPTNCILMIIKNSGLFTVTPGTYTSTSNGVSDANCNPGLSGAKRVFYGGSSYQQSTGRVWPASTELPSQDMTAAGITQVTTFNGSETGDEIVPVYISVNSACTGSALNDPASCAAVDNAGNNSGTLPPNSVGDTGRGYATTAPAANQPRYKFIINLNNSIGVNGSNQCSFAAAPVMQFVAF
jgi:hypothetical protein